MIERTNAFKVGDKSFLTLVDAQRYELEELATQLSGGPVVADWILANKTRILDILTTTNTSKPRARKVNGGTKRRAVTATNLIPGPTEVS